MGRKGVNRVKWAERVLTALLLCLSGFLVFRANVRSGSTTTATLGLLIHAAGTVNRFLLFLLFFTRDKQTKKKNHILIIQLFKWTVGWVCSRLRFWERKIQSTGDKQKSDTFCMPGLDLPDLYSLFSFITLLLTVLWCINLGEKHTLKDLVLGKTSSLQHSK